MIRSRATTSAGSFTQITQRSRKVQRRGEESDFGDGIQNLINGDGENVSDMGDDDVSGRSWWRQSIEHPPGETSGVSYPESNKQAFLDAEFEADESDWLEDHLYPRSDSKILPSDLAGKGTRSKSFGKGGEELEQIIFRARSATVGGEVSTQAGPKVLTEDEVKAFVKELNARALEEIEARELIESEAKTFVKELAARALEQIEKSALTNVMADVTLKVEQGVLKTAAREVVALGFKSSRFYQVLIRSMSRVARIAGRVASVRQVTLAY